MGPIRGYKRRKKEVDHNGSSSLTSMDHPSQTPPLDWWDDFSNRLTGFPVNFSSTTFFPGFGQYMPLYYCSSVNSHVDRNRENINRSDCVKRQNRTSSPQNHGQRKSSPQGSLSQSHDSAKFESIFKISRKTFKYICSLVKEEMMAKPSNFTDLSGKPLCLEDRVAVALRRLSSGESLLAVGDSFGMNQTTVAQITWRFVEAMEERGIHHLQWPSTENEMNEIKSNFEKIGGFPNCCGATDITHIKMCLSTVNPLNEVWYDKEKNPSMILQAIVGPDMRFLDIVTGWPGSVTDSQAFKSSSFFKFCEEGKRLNGKAIEISKGTELREYVVGDKGFPLLPFMLTPYQGKNLLDSEKSFNKRLKKTVMVAQMALTRLKETWKIIKGVMWRPDKNKLPRIVLVCCLLHNIIIDLNDEVQNGSPFSSCDHDVEYRQQIADSIDETASVMRKELSHHLSGRLPP